MKKAAFLLTLALSSTINAQELPTFAEISQAVSLGKQVSFVLHLDQCQTDHKLQPVTGFVTPRAVLILANNTLKASHKAFTLSHPGFLDQPVFEYIKYSLAADGKVIIKTTTLRASNYESLGAHEVQCTLGKGFRVFEAGMKSARA